MRIRRVQTGSCGQRMSDASGRWPIQFSADDLHAAHSVQVAGQAGTRFRQGSARHNPSQVVCQRLMGEP